MRTTLRSALCLSALVVAACGGISDPTKTGNPGANTSAVSGSLKGANPNATDMRVAIVWRVGNDGGIALGADAPIVNGSFSLNLAPPPASYFFPMNSGSVTKVSFDGSSSPPPTATEAPNTVTTPLRPQGGVGGSIATEMTVAIGGFLVYRDANGNGALDLDGEEISSSDVILGGDKELLLVDIQGGGTLDFEKLRDRSGILPQPGMNLAWTQGRWLGLNVVELSLSNTAHLPGDVCSGGAQDDIAYGGTNGSAGNVGGTANDSPSGPSSTPTSLPPPYDNPADVVCAPDGRSYTLKSPSSSCAPPSPPPPSRPNVCYGDLVPETTACGGVTGRSLAAGQPIPDGWPCPVAGADAGTNGGGGIADAGAGPG